MAWGRRTVWGFVLLISLVSRRATRAASRARRGLPPEPARTLHLRPGRPAGERVYLRRRRTRRLLLSHAVGDRGRGPVPVERGGDRVLQAEVLAVQVREGHRQPVPHERGQVVADGRDRAA